MLVEQFLRDRAWWRLDSAGPNAVHVARSVVSLLDAAAYLRDVPDDAPDILALEAAGCFRGGAFDPGPEGAVVVRDWQLADETTAGAADLLAALARAAHQLRTPHQPRIPHQPHPALSIPRQPGPPIRTRPTQIV
jgi:hypothetical protein